MNVDCLALAWAAGFFDGEGYVGLTNDRRPHVTYRKPHIAIVQVDRAVLDRFRDAMGGLGVVRGPTAPTKGQGRPQWVYTISAWRDLQVVCALLWNYLSPVKRDQFTRTLSEYHARPRQHRLSESDVRAIRGEHGPGMGYVRLARRFGVTPAAIRHVVLRRSWAHLD